MNPHALSIQICNSSADAPDYAKMDFLPADLTKVIIVRNGTENGNDTIDLQFTDEHGNKYVAMITERLFKQAAELTITDRN